MSEVLTTIIGFLEERSELPPGSDEERAAIAYVDAGYIDSIGIVELVVELESEYGIRFEPDELQSPEFRTIGGLAGMVERLRAAA
jgi:acyl carrier protein